MKKVFVGNLAWKATEDGLKSLFAQFGEVVHVKIVTDQYTGKSRGFGFVEMGSDTSAQSAIRELDGKPFMERDLRVCLAQDNNNREHANAGGGHNGQGRGNWGDRPRRPRNDQNFNRDRG